MKKIVLAALGALAALGLALAPAASADSHDDWYLNKLLDIGITSSPTRMIALGHHVCDELAAGMSANQVKDWLYTTTTFRPMEVGWILGSSVRAYCPQYVSRVAG
jgi:hypothetical protein